MVTATILMIFCVKESTPADTGADLQALVKGLAQLPALLPEDVPVAEAAERVPGLVEAIAAAASASDNLYLTGATVGGLANALWPLDDSGPTTVAIQAGQSVAPDLRIDLEFSQNLSLFDFDDFSDDDLLGSVTILASEQGAGPISKLARSFREASAYYVSYSVD
jgi:hypothetical protein